MKICNVLDDENVIKRMFIEYLDTQGIIHIEGCPFKASEILKECGGTEYFKQYNEFVDKLDRADYYDVISAMATVAWRVKERDKNE